ncbi:hypothetical protein MBLNU459_g5098t1 [Dothideomycetes sp. NU459]
MKDNWTQLPFVEKLSNDNISKLTHLLNPERYKNQYVGNTEAMQPVISSEVQPPIYRLVMLKRSRKLSVVTHRGQVYSSEIAATSEWNPKETIQMLEGMGSTLSELTATFCVIVEALHLLPLTPSRMGSTPDPSKEMIGEIAKEEETAAKAVIDLTSDDEDPGSEVGVFKMYTMFTEALLYIITSEQNCNFAIAQIRKA